MPVITGPVVPAAGPVPPRWAPLAAPGGARSAAGPALASARLTGWLDSIQRLALGQHVPDGGLGPGGQRAGPDLGRQQPDVSFQIQAVQPGQGLVDPPEAQVRPEEGEPDRGLAEQRGQQRRVGDVQPGHPGLRHGGVSAHRPHSSPVACAMQRLLPAHGGHKQASGNARGHITHKRSATPMRLAASRIPRTPTVATQASFPHPRRFNAGRGHPGDSASGKDMAGQLAAAAGHGPRRAGRGRPDDRNVTRHRSGMPVISATRGNMATIRRGRGTAPRESGKLSM